MRLAGWVLLFALPVGLLWTIGLMVRAFERIGALAGGATPGEVGAAMHSAAVPTWVGMALAICGLILLMVSGRRARRGKAAASATARRWRR